MKLQDLFENLRGTQEYRDRTWDELIAKLQQSKITLAGSGAYADVITSPEWDYAYKIFQLDSAYMAFLHLCEQNQQNPHLPKIIKKPRRFHSFHKRSHLSSDYLYAVKLEKLQRLTPQNKQIVEFVDDVAWQYIHGLLTHNLRDPFAKQDYNSNNFPDFTIDEIFEKYQHLHIKELLDTIKKINSNVRQELDLHSENFMQRKDGTIVIIDPVYNGKEMAGGDPSTPTTAPDDFRYIPKHTAHTTGPKYKK